MPYTVEYDQESECILVQVQGYFELSLLQQMVPEIAMCLKKNGCSRVLNDLRSAMLTDYVTDIYKIPESVQKAGVTREIKRALLVTEITPEFRFLETSFINRGGIVRLFTDIDKARKWLSESSADL